MRTCRRQWSGPPRLKRSRASWDWPIGNDPGDPRAAGSGLSGGAVPIHGGDRPPAGPDEPHPGIDRDNMMITVEPGVVTTEINQG